MVARAFRFRDGLEISRLGYGAMRLTGQPGNFGPYADWAGGVALLRRAQDLGIDHFDTARSYGPHDNERLIGEAFADAPPALVASKGGMEKSQAGDGFDIRRDGSAAALARHVAESRRDLGPVPIGLYYLHAPDRNLPIETSVAALAEAQAAGLIARIGLSNVTVAQIEAAQAVAPIDAVQNRLSPEDVDDQRAVLGHCEDHGIAFVAHGPLGAHPMRPGLKVPVAEAMAALLALSPNVLLIPGTTSVAHLEENAAAFEAVVGGG